MCRAWLWGFAFRCSAYGFLQMRDGMQMRIDLHWTSRRFSVEYQIVNHRRTSLYHPAIHPIAKSRQNKLLSPFDLLEPGFSIAVWLALSVRSVSIHLEWDEDEDEMMRTKSNLKICHLLIYGWHQRRRHRSFFPIFILFRKAYAQREWMLESGV